MDGSGPWHWAIDVETKTRTRVSVGAERYLSVAASADVRRLVATVAKSTATLWTVPISDDVANERQAVSYGSAISRAWAPRFDGEALLDLAAGGSGDGLWRDSTFPFSRSVPRLRRAQRLRRPLHNGISNNQRFDQ
jgi:hypothetical protein